MDLLKFLTLVLCFVFVTPQDVSELSKFHLAPKTAKGILSRVRRGWLPWERREEREEREENREAQQRERNREAAAAKLARECPTKCWKPWGAFGGCSKSCGGAGIRTQTRRVKSPQELGACKDWVAANGCPGPSRRTAACNRFCHNQGTPTRTRCTCKPGWSDTCCSTRITCPDPGKPANGAVTPGGGRLHFGTTVRFSCNTGYSLAGTSSRKCVGNGAWTNSVPKCNIVRCPTPPTPANSQLRLISGSAYVFLSSVRVTCNSGYTLRGTTVRRCEANGRWSGTAPSCARIMCGIHNSPSHGSVTFPGERTLNSQATYSCDSGYYLQGSPSRKCQSNGQWTGQVPSCQRIKCNNIAAPAHGSVTHEGSTGGKTTFGGKAKFTCSTGYVLRGASTLTCRGTSQQGSWSGARPSCQPVNCGDPGTPTNGVKTGSVYTKGSSVSFKCVAGYRLSGATSVQCQNNGRWSASKPQCTKCAANTYKEGTNTATSCTSCPAHSTTSGSTGATSRNTCICSAGYRGAPGGPCSRITCPSLPTPQHGLKKSCSNNVGGKCLFECKPGHVASRGDVTRTCEGNGAWSGRNLVCTACPVNTYKAGVSQCIACPDHTSTTGTGNEKSGCRCNTGWTGPHGGPCRDVNECQNQNGGCQQQCINSVGSYRCECNLAGFIKDADDHKKCNSKNRCSAMPRPSNGGVVCHSHRSTNTERCQVTCNPGYDHTLSPNAFEQCGPSTNWKWSHEISGTPILDCLESFFEEIQLELEVFYFASQCSSLTPAQKAQMAREFANFLTSRGICRTAGETVCNVDDVTIGCGTANRKRRTAGMEQMKISFMLKSMVKSKSKMRSCNAACKSLIMSTTRSKMMEETEKAKRVLSVPVTSRGQGREQGRGWGMRRPTAGAPGGMRLGGVNLFSSSVTQGQMTTTCSGNMIKTGDICATCPSGSYKVQARGECSLCPVGSHQPRAGQTMCLPCRTANTKGSKSCRGSPPEGLSYATE